MAALLVQDMLNNQVTETPSNSSSDDGAISDIMKCITHINTTVDRLWEQSLRQAGELESIRHVLRSAPAARGLSAMQFEESTVTVDPQDQLPQPLHSALGAAELEGRSTREPMRNDENICKNEGSKTAKKRWNKWREACANYCADRNNDGASPAGSSAVRALRRQPTGFLCRRSSSQVQPSVDVSTFSDREVAVHLKATRFRAVERQHGVLNPDGQFRIVWDAVMACCLIFLAIAVPIELGWDPKLPNEMIVLNVTLDFLFIFDIALSFFTGYEENLSYVFDRHKVARRYLFTWFVPDVFSSVPVQLIQQLMSEGASTEGLLALKLIRLSKLGRLSRFARLKCVSYLSCLPTLISVSANIVEPEHHSQVHLSYVRRHAGCSRILRIRNGSGQALCG